MTSGETSERTECRPFERRWRNYCVDRNLEDDWLERLNRLRVFDLISICEGHEDEPVAVHRRLPHFNLRLKDTRAEMFAARWSETRTAIGEAIDGCFFNKFTSIHFEFRSGFVKERERTHPQDIVLLKLAARVDVLDFDRAYYGREWFEENVAASEAFDGYIFEMIGKPPVQTE